MHLAVAASLMTIVASTCPGDPVDTVFSLYDGARPGASLAVIHDGTIVYERTYGMANLARQERTTPQTNFRLASVTKQFTAAAILLLAERGKLSLDDRAVKYLPELREVAPDVTLRHLLTHTSGLPEYPALLPKDDTKPVVDADVLALVAQQPRPKTAPGARYKYSNTGYALLAMIVERTSKQSYSEFLRTQVFAPLGMTATRTITPDAKIPDRALGYDGNAFRHWEHDTDRATTVLGDGGIYSSPRDLARWIDALGRHTLLSAARLDEATSPLVKTDAPGVSYGFGWRISEVLGEKLVFHTGTTTGFKNALLWVPARKLAVVILTNRKQGDPLTLGKLVLERFWDHSPTDTNRR